MSMKVIGPSLKNLTEKEMKNIYGTEGANVNVSPLTPATPATPGISATISAISGIVSFNKKCLG